VIDDSVIHYAAGDGSADDDARGVFHKQIAGTEPFRNRVPPRRTLILPVTSPFSSRSPGTTRSPTTVPFSIFRGGIGHLLALIGMRDNEEVNFEGRDLCGFAIQSFRIRTGTKLK